MNVRPLQPHERARWVEMRQSLWPDYPREQIEREAADYFDDGTIEGLSETVLVAEHENALVGFIEVSKRPYARGCVSSPVGYIEAWYVEKDFRRRRIGKALLAGAEKWAREQGFSELASDCIWSNDVSRAGHLSFGFKPPDRCTLFRKRILVSPDAAHDFIGIVPFELDAGSITNAVTDEKAGGIDVFLGTTRAETNTAGQALLALDYEAYREMATRQLHDLARSAREKWPIIKLAILHRIGRVEPGKASVVIAVSTPHRADAFDACRWIIDALKRDVAIWKKEIWSDGSGSWVNSK